MCMGLVGGGHLVFSAGKPGLSSYYTTTRSIAFRRLLNSLSLKTQSLRLLLRVRESVHTKESIFVCCTQLVISFFSFFLFLIGITHILVLQSSGHMSSQA